MTILAQLSAHFPVDAVSWRVGPTMADKSKGQALAYIDARDVMKRLDTVCGADWQCEYVPMSDGTACCRIGILIDGQWRWRSNGAVNRTDSDKADAQEMASKGSYSDAFKRAAVMWGIGRYLYDLPTPWVAIEARGRSFVISPDGEQQLRNALLRAAKADYQAPPQRAPEPAAPAPEPKREEPAPVASARPSYITQPATKDAKTKAAEEATNRAAAAQERMQNSEIIRKGWVADLGRYHAEITAGGRELRIIELDLNAWDQTRQAQWSKLVPHDQAIVSRALSKVKSAIAEMRAASKADAA
ncbi:MAG: hypothetical protein KA472_11245 [Pseudomonadales bacterium]|nr:hypothetical protein [Pseudomonadales bacterium]